MKQNRLNNIINGIMKCISVVILLLCVSCGDFLNEYSQDTAYVRGYEDLDELLLGSGYMPTGTPSHIAYSEDYIEKPWYYPYVHLMGDELDENIHSYSGLTAAEDAREKFFGYYTWQQQVGTNPTGTEIRKEDTDWNRIYKHINIVNMVLADIDKQNADNDHDNLEKQRIKGESYFLRGAYYFTMANLYGKPYDPATAQTDLAVPIKLTEYIEDKNFNRNTVEEVYQQAISDLLQAENLLKGTTRKSYYRANSTAADLLLSRLYLYKQDWTKAVEYAQKVIEAGDNSLQNLNTMTASFFLNPQLPEIIFSMGNGGLRETITGNAKDFGISEYLYGLYNDQDIRKTFFVKWDNTYKYAEFVKGGSIDDQNRTALSSNFLLRTAEAYLNLAEASAYNGDEKLALTTVNTLRKNRIKSVDYKDLDATGAALIDSIRDERERELCLEGHRWFDLRRYTVNIVRPFSKTIRHSFTTFEYNWRYGTLPIQTVYYELQTNDAAYTLPIPKEVVSFNIGMPNNMRPQRNVIETVNY